MKKMKYIENNEVKNENKFANQMLTCYYSEFEVPV